jgi:hypothetical protein
LTAGFWVTGVAASTGSDRVAVVVSVPEALSLMATAAETLPSEVPAAMGTGAVDVQDSCDTPGMYPGHSQPVAVRLVKVSFAGSATDSAGSL